MLCENCNKNQASVHTVEVINGVKQERYLCAQCADNERLYSPIMMGILSGFGRVRMVEEPPACECGAKLSDFERTGLLGCPECYKTFEGALLPVIRRAQGGRELHTGRRPQHGTAKLRDERAELEAALKEAVADERYEQAAELRDRLRAMEG